MDDELISIINLQLFKVLKIEVSYVVDPNQNLIQLGLSSIKFIELVIELEEVLNIEFDNVDLLIELFSSVNKIANVILKQRPTLYINEDECSHKIIL